MIIRLGGDTPKLMENSVELFNKHLGYFPEGYRANTFQINPSLLSAMNHMGFKWDSSLLPARLGFGSNRDQRWRKHNCAFHLGKYNLVEFPLATVPFWGLPFIHSYTCIGQMLTADRYLNMACLPELLIYDMHMVDLFENTKGLKTAKIPQLAKQIYKAMWLKGQQDTLDVLNNLIIRLKSEDYHFTTLTGLYEDLNCE